MDEKKYKLFRAFGLAECKKKKQLRIAERTLGLKLYKWQRAYILDKITYIPTSVRTARCTGKTFAQCLKICLSEGEPLDIRYLDYNKVDGYSVREDEYLWWQIDLYEDKETRQRYHYFVGELNKMYQILSSNKKLKLRPIKFHDIRF